MKHVGEHHRKCDFASGTKRDARALSTPLKHVTGELAQETAGSRCHWDPARLRVLHRGRGYSRLRCAANPKQKEASARFGVGTLKRIEIHGHQNDPTITRTA